MTNNPTRTDVEVRNSVSHAVLNSVSDFARGGTVPTDESSPRCRAHARLTPQLQVQGDGPVTACRAAPPNAFHGRRHRIIRAALCTAISAYVTRTQHKDAQAYNTRSERDHGEIKQASLGGGGHTTPTQSERHM